ncbi:MAG TPA: hypothetical protein VG204_17295 [Terriglobia bacterium]|nr:hypothetical protein [Terriglobia bacterium]
MFIVYEYTACVLTVLTGVMLLFAACVIFVVLEEGTGTVARKLQELTRSATWLIGRWAAESRDS